MVPAHHRPVHGRDAVDAAEGTRLLRRPGETITVTVSLSLFSLSLSLSLPLSLSNTDSKLNRINSEQHTTGHSTHPLPRAALLLILVLALQAKFDVPLNTRVFLAELGSLVVAIGRGCITLAFTNVHIGTSTERGEG